MNMKKIALFAVVPHRQVVCTIPKRLRPFFRWDRKLPGDLAACAGRALRLHFAACLDDADAVPGAVGFVQSAGELLNAHPHVHLLVADGGWSPDGVFHPLAGFDPSLVERIFQGEVLRMLTHKELISQEVVDNLLSWRHSGFSVHGNTRVATRQDAVRPRASGRRGRLHSRPRPHLQHPASDDGAAVLAPAVLRVPGPAPVPAPGRAGLS